MSAPIASSLKQLIAIEKKLYLLEREASGGTAEGFRTRIVKHIVGAEGIDKLKYDKFMLEAVREAATRCWQAQPRKRGPDLFRIGGLVIPETLTRPVSFVTGDEIEDDDETKFEKVDHMFGTVNDLTDDGMIKLRKSAQASAAANLVMNAADEARRRAKGNMAMFLREVADQPPPPPKDGDQPRPAA
jgi:hypothetical protein